MNKSVKVSIILPTFNNSEYIAEAISSVFDQRYKDWELIIINDASTDGTKKVIDKYIRNETRLKYYENKKNLGLVASLNNGISLSKGDFIARIDGDDIWLDKRKLEKQVKFLQENPEIDLLGTWAHKLDHEGNELAKLEFPVEDSLIRKYMLMECVFIHSSVIYRKRAALNVGGYDKSFPVGQDYELWLKLGTKGKMHNLANHMVGYRVNEEGSSRTKYDIQIENSVRAIKKHRRDYPFYSMALPMWHARKLMPRELREGLSRQVRKIIS